MAELVRHDIGLREVARRAKSVREFLEEAEVKVDPLVPWAVERPGSKGPVALSAAPQAD